jgi:HAD superfamily hydrolase (TIGR01459 family)
MPAIPFLDGLRALSGRYDAIICDVWGVLHNGIKATAGAPEALEAARRAGMSVVLLTNAPRPPAPIEKQLAGFGITAAAYDAIISSGGVTRALIAAEGNKPFHHLGPARDAPIYAGLAARPAPLDQADYILCTGLFDDETETAEDYRATLESALGRNLKLYCANPDLVVERGTTLLPCAGAIALLYEEMGGETIYVGKPHPLVYEHAEAELTRLAGRTLPKARILCVGDALRTDVAGGIRAGYDVLMVLGGIHGHEIALNQQDYDAAALDRLCARNGTRPTMGMVSLAW